MSLYVLMLEKIEKNYKLETLLKNFINPIKYNM